MSESLMGGNRISGDFTGPHRVVERASVDEAALLDRMKEPLFQPDQQENQSDYCIEKMMATDLVSVRHTIEHLYDNNELPFPHPSMQPCRKAAKVIASSIDFLRASKDAGSPEQLSGIPSIDQAVTAMREVFGDPLDGVDETDTHPLVLFFNTLHGADNGDAVLEDLESIPSPMYSLAGKLVVRWEELEAERIVEANRLSREWWQQYEAESA